MPNCLAPQHRLISRTEYMISSNRCHRCMFSIWQCVSRAEQSGLLARDDVMEHAQILLPPPVLLLLRHPIPQPISAATPRGALSVHIANFVRPTGSFGAACQKERFAHSLVRSPLIVPFPIILFGAQNKSSNVLR